MGKKVNNETINVKKKEITAAKKGIAAAKNAEKKAAKKERNTLNATIAYIAEAEFAGAGNIRQFLGLKKDATRMERKYCAARVLRHANVAYIHVTQSSTNESDECNIINVLHNVAIRNNGRAYNDWLDVIYDMYKQYTLLNAECNTIAAAARAAAKKYRAEKKLTKEKRAYIRNYITHNMPRWTGGQKYDRYNLYI